MNILLTGAIGFIGSNLVEKLKQTNNFTVGIDNFADMLYSPKIKEKTLNEIVQVTDRNFKFRRCDLLDTAKLDKLFKEFKFDLVIHLAAHAGVRPSINNIKEYYANNVNGTLNLLEVMKANNCNKIIFASSSSVYGNCQAEEFVETELNLTPISPYAATKLAGEHMLNIYNKINNFSVICLRFFTVYGPRQRPDLAIHKFANRMLEGSVIDIYGDGHNVRDYTYIDDIISGITGSINYITNNPNCYEIFNLGGGNPVSLSTMVNTIAKELNIEPKLHYMEMQQGDVEKTVSNCDKAKKLLGYQVHTSFEEGIKKFINWKLNK